MFSMIKAQTGMEAAESRKEGKKEGSVRLNLINNFGNEEIDY